MKDELNHFLLAVQFLTRLPVGRWLNFERSSFPASTMYFPVVGALIGFIGVEAFRAGFALFGETAAVIIAMLAMLMVTGALHEDGLADAADGFGGGVTKERVLEIMRDSRIGSYGAAAIWFALALKWASLQTLLHRDYASLGSALIIAPMLSRLSCLDLLHNCDYVREASATTKPFATKAGMKRGVIAVAIAAFLGLVLTGSIWIVAAVFFACWAVTQLCKLYCKRRIGGITGDCLGATIVISELTVYLTFVALT